VGGRAWGVGLKMAVKPCQISRWRLCASHTAALITTRQWCGMGLTALESIANVMLMAMWSHLLTSLLPLLPRPLPVGSPCVPSSSCCVRTSTR
jgi:hypothetical protein